MVGVGYARRLCYAVLRRSKGLVLALVTGFCVLSATTSFADPPPPPGGVGVGCIPGRCGVGAYDPGAVGGNTATNPTGTTNTGGNTATDTGSGAGASAPVDPGACVWKALPSQPAAGSALWEGNDPASGAVEYTNCLSVGGSLVAPYRFVANAAAGAAPVAPPPPDPAVLAQQAFPSRNCRSCAVSRRRGGTPARSPAGPG